MFSALAPEHGAKGELQKCISQAQRFLWFAPRWRLRRKIILEKAHPLLNVLQSVNGGFFNQFDRFLATSKTSPFLLRLNGRHEGIIAANANLLRGKRILDIASHDGRWSFAALKAGAVHVTGIEPRKELIDNARQTFAGYGIPASSYEFLCGDVFDVLAKRPLRFDLVLCLGFYYHTIRHVELFDRMERTGALDIVIDTAIAPTPGNMIQLMSEPVANESMACEDLWTRAGQTIVGHPSRAAVQFIAAHFGFETGEFNWASFFARNPECATDMADYTQGLRATFVCHRRQKAEAN